MGDGIGQIWHHRIKSSVSRDRLVVRTLRCGRSNPGSNPGHGMQKQIFLFWFIERRKNFGFNRDLNLGPLAPKARIIPLDHWAIVWLSGSKLLDKHSKAGKFTSVTMKASIAQWQSVGLVNQRSWVQSSLEASRFFKKIFWPRRDSNTQPSDLESDALPLRHGVTYC